MGFIRRTTQVLFGTRQAPAANPQPAVVPPALPPPRPLEPQRTGLAPLPPDVKAKIVQAESLCLNKYNLTPGARMLIYVRGELMILRRTQTGDGFVLQTAEKTDSEPFNGLFFGRNPNGEQVLKLDLHQITPDRPFAYAVAVSQFQALLGELAR